MDLTTLGAALLMAMSLLGVDAYYHAGGIVVEVSVPAKLDRLSVDAALVEGVLNEEMYRITAVQSLLSTPQIRVGRDKGVAMALFSMAKAEPIAYALQTQFGSRPDMLRVTLFSENNAAKILLTGNSLKQQANFEEELVQRDKETIIDLVRRAALLGVSRMDPYTTALYLMRAHERDKNFVDAESLAQFAISQLAPTPINSNRSDFENLLGILALFRDQPKEAQAKFEAALRSSPDNAVAKLNVAFVELQLDEYASAAERMRQLVDDDPTRNPILISTAYTTMGAAMLGLKQLDQADLMLAKAVKAYPENANAYSVWAIIKSMAGDAEAAARLRRRALEATGALQNYAEVATLYFELSWDDGQVIRRNRFFNPVVVSFH